MRAAFEAMTVWKLHQIDQSGLNKLRLWQGRGHAQYRFIGEEHRPFRHRIYVAGEAQCSQTVDESRREGA